MEVTHVGCVQLFGMILEPGDEKNCVASQGFGSWESAIAWATHEVGVAHGGHVETVIVAPNVWRVTTDAGPVNAFVMCVA